MWCVVWSVVGCCAMCGSVLLSRFVLWVVLLCIFGVIRCSCGLVP